MTSRNSVSLAKAGPQIQLESQMGFIWIPAFAWNTAGGGTHG